MWPIEVIEALLVGSLTMCLAASAGDAGGDDPVPRPDAMQDSPAEQSAWLDQVIPELVAAMRASEEVRAKVAGPLAAVKATPSPLTPQAEGLAPGDLGRWSVLADAAVAANPRYGRVGKAKPRPTVAVMPHTGIVRVEATYPAPPASKDLEPGPLTIDAWVCPDRETALALFWLRSVVLTIDTRLPETLRQSVLDTKAVMPLLDAKEKPPGERAFWYDPRFAISVILTKGHKPMPADRLCFLRGNMVVEASTVEFTRGRPNEEWKAWPLERCAPDVVAIMRAIDAGLNSCSQHGK